jgi:hypothetical protein
MIYSDRFIATDNLITHLSSIIVTITDPQIQASYAGFLSVSAVTVYELAIKDIFSEFGKKKNLVFGEFVTKHFGRINGKIKISELNGEHIKCFGDKYSIKFNKILKSKEDAIMKSNRVSIINSYGNLILCRHDFVHKGIPTLTVIEVIDSYHFGKEIIHCLSNAMQR